VLLEKGATTMKGNWLLMGITAGSLLLGVTHGAAADRSRHDRSRDDRSHHSDRQDEHQRVVIRGVEVRHVQRKHRHDERTTRVRDKRSQRPFAYIRATDRAHHRS
jgi:hypothetical protein